MAGSFRLERARNDLGQFVADDPSTPQNEAWIAVPLTNDVSGAVEG